jgi:hypothetical protein
MEISSEGEAKTLKPGRRNRSSDFKSWCDEVLNSEKPVQVSLAPLLSEPDSSQEIATLWIPSAGVRPPQMGPLGNETSHELTRDSRTVLHKANNWVNAKDPSEKSSAEKQLRWAIRALKKRARNCAIGQAGKGYKEACLGKEILSPRIPRSGRAVVVPAGLDGRNMELDLDEVGLPAPIACAVLNRNDIQNDEDLCRLYPHERPPVWIKRDPVLHRWGLLGARVRVIEGNVIRLPASLLRALGADFDGDTVMVFGKIPIPGASLPLLPSVVAWDEVLKRCPFLPGKQFAYGVHLLQQDSGLLGSLNEELKEWKAPEWPTSQPAQDALKRWASDAAQSESDKKSGKWWEIIERHALKALGRDPGMEFGLCPWTHWPGQPVITCGAAKGENFTSGSEQYFAYRGGSLDVFDGTKRGSQMDLIETVMVANAGVTGKFGNVPRHLLYAAQKLTREFVRNVQALSEPANQQMLSVKAGQVGLTYKCSKQVLDPMLEGRDLDPNNLDDSVRRFLEENGLLEVCKAIKEGVYPKNQVPSWLHWLKTPTNLKIPLETGYLELPAEDPRVGPFLVERSLGEGGSETGG